MGENWQITHREVIIIRIVMNGGRVSLVVAVTVSVFQTKKKKTVVTDSREMDTWKE